MWTPVFEEPNAGSKQDQLAAVAAVERYRTWRRATGIRGGGASLIANATVALNVVDAQSAVPAAVLCLGGAGVLVGQQRGRANSTRIAARLLCAVCLVAYGLLVPQRGWTGVALYACLGLALVLETVARQWLHDVTPTSLRMRLVLTLIGVASVPMIATTAALAAAAERAAIADASADQEVAAVNIARTIGQFDIDYRGLVWVPTQPVHGRRDGWPRLPVGRRPRREGPVDQRSSAEDDPGNVRKLGRGTDPAAPTPRDGTKACCKSARRTEGPALAATSWPP